MTARIVVYLRPDQLSWLEEEELRRASGKGRAGARSAIVREALDVKMSAERPARARALSPERRAEIARKGAAARWHRGN